MLLQLNIVNFALIENLSMDFTEGFNVLSGETGSGKSILIDAINFVLGEKFNRDIIRTGENKTTVEAVFSIENEKTKLMLKELDIEHEDLIIINREVFINGKSIVKINNKAVLLSNLKTVAKTLIDIHGQHENQNLLDSLTHLNYLDSFGDEELFRVKNTYSEIFNKVLEIESKIKTLNDNKDINKLIDYYEFQIKDIDSAKLKPNEDMELEEKSNLLSNAEKINSSLNKSYNLLYSKSENLNALDVIGNALKELTQGERHYDKIKRVSSNLQEVYYNLQEIVRDIRDLSEEFIYDENELEKVNGRIFEISLLKKKYGKTIEDILNYRDEISKKYNELLNSEEILKSLVIEKEKLEVDLEKLAISLHKLRESTAEILIHRINEELKYVGLEKCKFSLNILFTDKFNQYGKSNVIFLISTNPGEPLKPLDKIVSGGELSRIMLALKTVFVDKDMIPTVIFDEIDTGISGRIAQCVAEKMHLISNSHQVFCVTHLPQIAAMADEQYLVYKEVLENKTYTFLRKLDDNEKILEVAKMIGGAEVTNLTLENAKELRKNAKIKKNI